MNGSLRLLRVSAVAVAACLALVSGARAQTAGCAVVTTIGAGALPNYSGTLQGVLSTAGGTSYVYILTQYGFVRASLTDPAHPGPLQLAQVGKKTSLGDNGGVVPMICDCWQGGTTMDAAESPTGVSRMISDWRAGGGGLPAQMAEADIGVLPAFGQQISVPGVPLGSRIAALYLPASGKYVGYFPSTSGVIQVVDISNGNGNPATGAALIPFATVPWDARVLKATQVLGRTLLAGANSSRVLKIGEIASDGTVAERASVATRNVPIALAIAPVNGRVFVFSAESSDGIQIYEFSLFANTLTRVGSLPAAANEVFNQIVVKGGVGPFPIIFAHRELLSFPPTSYIDIYDSNWITQGGAPRLGKSLPQMGGPTSFNGRAVEAVVRQEGGATIAYVYRLQTTSPESSLHTTKVDLSCISVDPTAPPVANATMTNLSAQSRTGIEATLNYYGDRWEIRDASATASVKPLDGIHWDIVQTGAFAADPALSQDPPLTPLPAGKVILTGYWPCDPVSGDIASGANCHASLGSPSAGASYTLAMETHNENGWSTPRYSSTIPVSAPDALVVGLQGGILSVLSGQGQADARISEGNPSVFAWTFRSGATIVGQPTGGLVPVPATADGFDLAVTYPSGYVANASGTIAQVDLVPNFTLSPTTVLKSGTLTLTNTMLISAAATLNSVTYAITQGATTVSAGALASSFLPPGGVATLTAPDPVGSYTMTLTYNYTAPAGSQSATVSRGFSTIFNLTVALTGPSSGSRGLQIGPFTVTTTGGSGSTTYAWAFDYNVLCSGSCYVAGPATNSYTYTNGGVYRIRVRATDGGATAFSNTHQVTISGGAPPPPPPPPPGSFSVTLSGPGSGVTGTPVVFTATATGGTPPYTYGWVWDYNQFVTSYPGGPSTNSYAYTSPGNYTLRVRAADSAARIVYATKPIAILQGGPPPPSASFTIEGAHVNPFNGSYTAEAGTVLTFQAIGTNIGSYSWTFGDGATATGNPVTHVYAAAGVRSVGLTVTGNGTQTVGSASSSKSITLSAPAFQALMVPGAAHLDLGDDIWATDISVTNPATTPMTLDLAFIQFLDGAPDGLDISQLTYSRVDPPLAPGGTWSKTDVVKDLVPEGASQKGTLIIRYQGSAVPKVNGRVYFAKKANPLGASYGASIEAYRANPRGRSLAPAGVQGIDGGADQTLVGLASTNLYRFVVSLYNSSGEPLDTRITAFDGDGQVVLLKDLAGQATLLSRDVRMSAYQQQYFRGEDLIDADPAKKYVFKISKTGPDGSLIAYGTALDRQTNDLIQFTDDTPPPVSKSNGDGTSDVQYHIPGVSRFDTGYGAKWRTNFAIRNTTSGNMGVLFTYRYFIEGSGTERVATQWVVLEPEKLLAYDDIVGDFFDSGTDDDLKALSSFGVITLAYREFAVSENAPFAIVARNYDNQPNGTSGTQLSVFSRRDAVSVGEPPLVLSGAEEGSGADPRLRTVIGAFAMDDELTRVRVTLVRKDGSVVGDTSHEFVLNQPGGSGHIYQIYMSDVNALPDIVRDEPMSVRAEVLEGGRAGVYLVTVDTHTRDTSFSPGRLQR